MQDTNTMGQLIDSGLLFGRVCRGVGSGGGRRKMVPQAPPIPPNPNPAYRSISFLMLTPNCGEGRGLGRFRGIIRALSGLFAELEPPTIDDRRWFGIEVGPPSGVPVSSPLEARAGRWSDGER